MAKTYRMTPFVRLSNAIVAALVRRGAPLGGMALLTVQGRTSGLPRTVPVSVLERDGQRWLGSPFGEVSWVRNLRAAGHATLTRVGREEAIVVEELSAPEAAEFSKTFLGSLPAMIRGYFDVTPHSTLEEFERAAPRHPLFRVVSVASPEDEGTAARRSQSDVAAAPASNDKDHARWRDPSTNTFVAAKPLGDLAAPGAPDETSPAAEARP